MSSALSNGITNIPSHVPRDRVADIDVYALPGMDADYHQAWHDVQNGHPELVWTPKNEGHWIALRGDLIAEVQSDYGRFSSEFIIIPKSLSKEHNLLPSTIDPPAHRPYRILLNSTFSPASVRRRLPLIQSAAAELIEGFVAKGRCDFTADYARIFPVKIFMGLVDLPMSDAPMVQYWAESITRPNFGLDFASAKSEFYNYLRPVLAKRRLEPADDLLSLIASSEANGIPLSDEDALSISTQILIAGLDTVVNFLSFAMLFLARNPEERRRLRDEPSGIMSAMHELFRRFGLVTIARTVREDMEYRGVQLKAGEMVCLPTVLHGLDDRLNPNPMVVDLDRVRGRHSAFGSGPHMCPGQELARVEVAITVEEWLKRIPEFEVAADADTSCGGSGIVGTLTRLTLEWDPT